MTLRASRLICASGLCCLLLQGCAEITQRQQVYVVRPHDTLYSIAWRYGLDFHDLARWNHLGPDFRITVGTALTLAPPTPAAAPALPTRPSSEKTPLRSAPLVSGIQWEWPTDRSGALRPVASGGILLSGQIGQEVRAAAAGRVVYTGSGIRGYGNLIIIKHEENLLSAYAHNRDSLVRESQQVSRGEVIGHMGEGAPNKPVLYFEIRRNGKPIDPLSFLPK